jgi:hypothetical protein
MMKKIERIVAVVKQKLFEAAFSAEEIEAAIQTVDLIKGLKKEKHEGEEPTLKSCPFCGERCTIDLSEYRGEARGKWFFARCADVSCTYKGEWFHTYPQAADWHNNLRGRRCGR